MVRTYIVLGVFRFGVGGAVFAHFLLTLPAGFAEVFRFEGFQADPTGAGSTDWLPRLGYPENKYRRLKLG